MKVFGLLFMGTILFTNASGQEPSDRAFGHSLSTKAKASEIWQIWMDVSSWKDWDTGLKDAALEGELKLGAKGKITTLEGRKVPFKVVEFNEGKSYTYKTTLPLGGLYVKRFLEEENGVTKFTHKVWFQGLTAGIFAKMLGGQFRDMLPRVLDNINQIALSKDADK